VLRNKIDDDAGFGGVDGPRCPRAPENARPKAFLINKGSASGTFQEDFKNGEVQHSERLTGKGSVGANYASHLYQSP
jgi:hypothetical protein